MEQPQHQKEQEEEEMEPGALPADELSELKQAEQEIDQNVFNAISKKKQKRFKRTVMAVHAIVTHKLYKTKASSLEVYFKDSWNISRAQVYRFLDCAWVLKQLEGFPEPPTKERFCRCLKKLAKNKVDMLKLWEKVLIKVNHDHDAISSNLIHDVWKVLVDEKVVTGLPDPNEDVNAIIDYAALDALEADNAMYGISPTKTDMTDGATSYGSQESSNEDLIFDRLEEVGASQDLLQSLVPNALKRASNRPSNAAGEGPSHSRPPVYPDQTTTAPQYPSNKYLFRPDYPSRPQLTELHLAKPPQVGGDSWSYPRRSFDDPQISPLTPLIPSPSAYSKGAQEQSGWRWTRERESFQHPTLSADQVVGITSALAQLEQHGYFLQPYYKSTGCWMTEVPHAWRLAPHTPHIGPPLLVTLPPGDRISPSVSERSFHAPSPTGYYFNQNELKRTSDQAFEDYYAQRQSWRGLPPMPASYYPGYPPFHPTPADAPPRGYYPPYPPQAHSMPVPMGRLINSNVAGSSRHYPAGPSEQLSARLAPITVSHSQDSQEDSRETSQSG